VETHIVEKLATMVANGEMKAEYLNVESEHSAMASCIGAQVAGVRSYTATSSQGLAYMWELLHVVSGMRLPIVMNVMNRALSAPLNIWNDWSDAMGCRDAGWIQLYCENVQEGVDTTIQAFRIAEHRDVLLPVMVCMDGFFLSHVYEPVDIPDNLKGFVSEYRPIFTLDPANPLSIGEYANPAYFQEFKEVQYKAMNNAKRVISAINEEFGRKFGRKYGNGLVETYNMPARHAIVTMGSVAGTIRHVLDRKKVKDVGLVKIRSFRPFPTEELKSILSKTESIGVLEKDVSLGIGGALWSELKGVVRNKPISNFIAGLGGRDIKVKDMKKIFNVIRQKGEDIYWIGSKSEYYDIG
jgi:pyruvate ferredoxin oxidoreductase alpha subunit